LHGRCGRGRRVMHHSAHTWHSHWHSRHSRHHWWPHHSRHSHGHSRHSWHSRHSRHTHWLVHSLLLLHHLHLSLSHLLSLHLLLVHHGCLVLLLGHHWRWCHSWSHHLRMSHRLRHSWHWRSHHWLLHWHAATHLHSMRHSLLLDHHHVLVSLHHHHLLLLDCLHVSHWKSSTHHLLLVHHHGVLSWVELSSVSSLSCLVLLSVLLHLLEGTLLLNHSLLSFKHFKSGIVSFFFSFFDLICKKSELSTFDGQWVLFVVVGRESKNNIFIFLILEFTFVMACIKHFFDNAKW
jgi:hypothetical protein